MLIKCYCSVFQYIFTPSVPLTFSSLAQAYAFIQVQSASAHPQVMCTELIVPATCSCSGYAVTLQDKLLLQAAMTRDNLHKAAKLLLCCYQN